MRKLVLALVVAVGAVCVGCGPKDEVMDQSPVANQAPKTAPAPKVNKMRPMDASAGDNSAGASATPGG